ncbi:MAG TPA: ATP-dependent Clp protease ATP-binding subunit, partial [Candidatus Parcubacteria bacterium]|nr:ATP-dependent Clp protease ATP-binding subunit [Candidatus Parcubacteria bacterium]
LAHKSLLGKSSSEVNYKRIVELDMSLLLSEIENIETAESVLNKIFEEVARAGNVILVIDEFYNYVGQQTGIGMLDISGVLNSYLRLPQFKLIAITTYQGFHRYIEKNPSMASLFEKIEVEGISMRDTLILLEYLTFFYEKKYKIFVSYPALRRIIEFSDRYFPSFPFPEKAINILDAVAAFVANSIAGRVVLPKHIAKIVSEKTEIPVGEVEKKEKDILLNLENLIHQRVINQEEAVRDVAVALRRARSEIATKKGPMGSFLFLGPTGVGKTETAKALAEVYFGSEEKMIRLDMSEFQNVEDIKHLIGSSSENGILTDKVRDNPFSLVLLDEIEKAHPNILNLFLQVLDEGHLTDGVGRKVDFRNTIIIATGNAGYKTILESLNQGGREEAVDWKETKQKLLNELFEKRIFRPEFINRFDAFVVFKPLSRENLLDISELIMRKLKKNLGEKGIDFVITEKLKEKIVKLSYNPVFGAREMKRVVQDKVESVLASALLSGRIKRGQRVELNPDDFSLKISPEI